MECQFVGAGRDDDDLAQRHGVEFDAGAGAFDFDVHRQRILATRHRKVDIGQQFGVQQCAVELAVGVGDAVAVAQRVQRVALARVHFLGVDQGVDHAAAMRDEARLAQALEFGVQEAQVERRVVDDDFGAVDVGDQLVDDLVEFRFVAQEFRGQAVHRERGLVGLALGIDVAVVVVAGQRAVDQLDAADLDDAVAGSWVQAGGFGIEDYQPVSSFL